MTSVFDRPPGPKRILAFDDGMCRPDLVLAALGRIDDDRQAPERFDIGQAGR
jgi:hypothetical protein